MSASSWIGQRLRADRGLCLAWGSAVASGCTGWRPADRIVRSARAPNTAREARALPTLNTRGPGRPRSNSAGHRDKSQSRTLTVPLLGGVRGAFRKCLLSFFRMHGDHGLPGGCSAGVLACEFTGRPAWCSCWRRDAAATRSRDGCTRFMESLDACLARIGTMNPPLNPSQEGN